jgi:arylsulfatase A-like enzyme
MASARRRVGLGRGSPQALELGSGRRSIRGVCAALLFVLALSGACDSGQPESDAWNVVLVVIDTLRADHLGLYGYDRDTTPRLEALARESFVFERAQSSAPWTAPSLISLVTSLYPDAHGVRSFPDPGRLDDEVTTLAELLQARGYATAAFTEGGYAKGDFGLDQGFTTFPDNRGDDEGHGSNVLYPSRLESNLDRALAWLGDHFEEPFFLLFHTYEPHAPYRAPEAYIRRFHPSYESGAEHERLQAALARWSEHGAVDASDLLLLERHARHCHPTEVRVDLAGLERFGRPLGLYDAAFEQALLAWIRDAYDAEIAYTDEVLTRLWDALLADGLRERTLIVVTSDHGEGLGDHGAISHGSVLFEEALRVPLVLRVPAGRFASRRIDSVVSTVDVMPTILELLGIASDGLRLQGRSLVPLLAGEPLERMAFSHGRNTASRDPLYSLRVGSWRYNLNRESGRSQLYDLQTDPGETENVVSQHPSLAAQLRGVLEAQIQRDRALKREAPPRRSPRGLPEDTLEELRALGYLESEPPGPSAAPGDARSEEAP